MMKQVSSVAKDSWSEQGVLSFEEVHASMLEYWLRILPVYKEITSVRRLFTQRRMPCPAQYKHMLTVLDTLRRSVQKFCRFLDKSARLPLVVCAARYSLIKALHRLDAQIGELSALITLLRSLDQHSSRETILLLQDIRKKLREVHLSWNSIEYGTQALLDRTQISPEEKLPRQAQGNVIEFDRKKTNLQEKRSQIL